MHAQSIQLNHQILYGSRMLENKSLNPFPLECLHPLINNECQDHELAKSVVLSAKAL